MWIPEQLYSEILRSMPIPCVDLVVQNYDREILLVKRKNEPAKNEWWFPGGRIYIGETRANAAVRKLWEECGLIAHQIREIGTYDLILSGNNKTHAVTTVFQITVEDSDVKLDNQSESLEWLTLEKCLKNEYHSFITQTILNL